MFSLTAKVDRFYKTRMDQIAEFQLRWKAFYIPHDVFVYGQIPRWNTMLFNTEVQGV